MKTVAGLFETTGQAERAATALRHAGFQAEDIAIVVRHATDPNASDVAEGRAEAAGVGAIGGGALGALGGLVVGVSAFVVPGIGPALAAGTIASTVVGGTLGAAAGGLAGGLIDAGLREEDAHHYQAGVERGGVLIAVVTPEHRETKAREILNASGLRDLEYHRSLWEENPSHRYDVPATTGLDTRPGAQMKGAENEGAILAGGATGAVVGMAIGGLVSGPMGAAIGVALGALSGGLAGAAIDYNDVEPHFREEWEHGPHSDRFDWNQSSAAYRYGWESAGEPEFLGRSWRDVRPDLERRWPGGPAWNDIEPLVRTAWDRRTRGETW
ncbi:MAG: hypothetical protein P4L84_20640 [Isosphaeraceae bacterium]|nr:hypothetical protein [Isosphaeraceae bacterium]